MKRIVAVVQPWAIEEVKRTLTHQWIAALTVSEVTGPGTPGEGQRVVRGALAAQALVPRLEVAVVVPTPLVPRVVDDLSRWLRGAGLDDGLLRIEPVDEVVRIRTGERGEGAL